MQGNIDDAEAEYKRRKAVYDDLVEHALANNDASNVPAIAEAKKAMAESLSKILELSTKSGTDVQQQELIRRIMQIQRDYNGLLSATDKLETLRRIHQTMDLQNSTGLKTVGLFFTVGFVALLVMLLKPRT